MTKHFADRLINQMEAKNSVVCVGIDPILERIPAPIVAKAQESHGPTLIAAVEAIANFSKSIVEAVADLVPAVKLQAAYFEQFGSQGMWAFEQVANFAAEQGLIVIADVKRGDIGSTAKAYSSAYLGATEVFGKKEAINRIDAVTVNPYMGSDTILPFLDDCGEFGKGVFVLVKTSNPASGDIQGRKVDESGFSVSDLVAQLVESWGSQEVGERGYSYVGAVAGATYPAELAKLRELMPASIFLIPGYGAQGATAKDVSAAFGEDGFGALINSSRAINYAYEDSKHGAEGFMDAAREAVEKMNEELNEVR